MCGFFSLCRFVLVPSLDLAIVFSVLNLVSMLLLRSLTLTLYMFDVPQIYGVYLLFCSDVYR